MQTEPRNESPEATHELPALLNTWRKMYAFVLGQLVVLVLLLYWFTKHFE